MKSIKLPVTETFSITMDMKESSNHESEGIIELGSVYTSDVQKNNEQARINGGKVLYATTLIEQELESILLRYFVGEYQPSDNRRNLFSTEILQSSALSFNAKKELLKKIINKEKILKGKEKDSLQKYLKNIMEWRNAFAHGKIQYDNKKGCFLKYYSGGNKTLELSDHFLTFLEETFVKTDKQLKEINDNISSVVNVAYGIA